MITDSGFPILAPKSRKHLKELSLILLFLISGLSVTQAQFKNILLDPNGSYEPSVAVNREDTQNIIVSAAPDNIYYTSNSGLSWEKTKLTSSFGTSASITLLADFKGKFYCLRQAIQNGKSRIVIQESGDGGQTWSEGALISVDTSKYAVYPRATVDRRGNLFVTWTDFDTYESDNENCLSRVMLSRSSNGRKWSKPTELSQTPGNCRNDDNSAMGAMPSVMGGGERAFVVWSNQQKIFFDRAFDGGTTWLSNDLAITDQKGGWKLPISGTKTANGMPVLLSNTTKKTNLTGALYLMWADQQQGETDSDIWFSRSLSYGDNWDQHAKVNDDKPGRHQYLPAMAFDSQNGNIYILFYDRRNSTDESTEVYLAYSTDSGSKFKNVKISSAPFVSDASVSLGNFIGIAAHDGVITPVWTRTENGKSSVYISIIRQDDLDKLK